MENIFISSQADLCLFRVFAWFLYFYSNFLCGSYAYFDDIQGI
jgi:hypothetical protein